jgi:hypothetical protein
MHIDRLKAPIIPRPRRYLRVFSCNTTPLTPRGFTAPKGAQYKLGISHIRPWSFALWNFASRIQGTLYVSFKGHTADCPSLYFSSDDRHIATTGQTYRTILVWKIKKK